MSLTKITPSRPVTPGATGHGDGVHDVGGVFVAHDDHGAGTAAPADSDRTRAGPGAPAAFVGEGPNSVDLSQRHTGHPDEPQSVHDLLEPRSPDCRVDSLSSRVALLTRDASSRRSD